MRTAFVAIFLGLSLCTLAVKAQPLVLGPEGSVSDLPRQGERLSAWLLRTHGAMADTTSLHWLHFSERHPQGQIKQQMLQDLDARRLTSLYDWVSRLPITGRVVLSTMHARAFEANPQHDPVADKATQFILYPRPQHVVVLNEFTQPCVLQHQPGALAQDYVQACQTHAPEHWPAGATVDRAWIAQPNGRHMAVGLAPWSLTMGMQPAPGAYIWAPTRQSGVSERISEHMAQLLSIQAPPSQHPMLADAVQVRVAAPLSPVPPLGGSSIDDLRMTRNDWGEMGYWQTPSARMAPAGTLSVSFSQVQPYSRLSVMFQPFDWLEGGFRYTDVSNRLYGPSIAGSQSYKDKSFDVKFRLWPEGPYVPQVTVGLRDIGGTGLFSSEYLVASKRWGSVDTTLGLAWGNLGSRGNVSNPLASASSRFNNRSKGNVGQGGTTDFGAMFAGPTALIGGVQWAPSTSPWVFKAEVDGNSYQNETQNNNQAVSSPINLGMLYRWGRNTQASVSWQRGRQVMFGLSWGLGLSQLHTPKTLDPALPRFLPQAPVSWPDRGWADVSADIERHTGWQVKDVSELQSRIVVRAETDNPVYLQERMDRVVAVLHALAPQGFKHFELHLFHRGLPLKVVSIDRTEWVLQRNQPLPKASLLPLQTTHALDTHAALQQPAWQASQRGIETFWAPTYSQILGGPDSFILYALGLALNTQWQLAPNTWISGSVNTRLLDNYDKFQYTAPSDLPRVRTFAREYNTTADVTLPDLQLTHAQALGGGHFASVYGGMLEPMFGGAGAEWLYRPSGSRLAVGIDVNRVRQRSFEQDFSFRSYSVDTGHLSLYWDTGFQDIHAQLQVGQYLAGDKGATLDLKRTFANGVAIGAWATKTNVSAEQFGEGSFDKGIYIKIPFDVFSPRSSPGMANIVWNPLTRDGGARLHRDHPLFDLTQARSPRALHMRAAQ